MVAHLGRAVGRLFLTQCDVTEMSGFFVGPDHFLNCAHFSPGNGIEDQMKESDSEVARVSIFRVPSSTYDQRLTIFISLYLLTLPFRDRESPLHLILRDEDKDFALFARNPLEGKDVGQGKIDVDRLVDASLSSFPNVFAERRIFTFGSNPDYKRECFAETLESVKKSLESEQQAELLDRDKCNVCTFGTQVDQSHSDILS